MNRFLASPLVKAGLALFVVGCGPLLLIIGAAALGLTSDPDPNPIGPGLLAFITFWPSVILTGIGVIRVMRAGERPGPSRNRVLMIPLDDAQPASAGFTALLQSPVGRAAAAAIGLMLVGNGIVSFEDGGRGPASALVIGAVCLLFARTGRMPAWFRR